MFNSVKESKKIISSTVSFFNSTKKKGIVLGVSGGVDSAVCLKILTKSISPKKITALLMPEKKNSNLTETISFVEKTKANYFVLELNPLLRKINFPWKQNELSEMNLKSRIRMLFLYNYANANNYLVCGTSNKSELQLGYFTKYGDGAADFLLLGNYWKTQVFELAKIFNVPEKIINKIPSAELKPNQSDEKDFGAKYELIDKILIQLNKKKPIKENKKLVANLINKITENKHKLSPPKNL